MAQINVTLQNVNGDPFVDGGNINITTGTTTGVTFNEPTGDTTLSTVSAGDTVTIGGVEYTYQYLGSGDVRGDPNQPAAFIRILGPAGGGTGTIPEGTTYAIDLTGSPGDPDYPNLQNGNTKLKVSELDTTTETSVPCFVAGTLIATPGGPRPVEALAPGDLVLTLDRGPQPVRWAGQVEVPARGALAPVRFEAGVIGNTAPLLVSPQHRVLLRDARAELLFGAPEVLVAAVHLVDGRRVRRCEGGRVRYVHFMFDRHEIVLAEGAPAESLFVSDLSLSLLPEGQRREMAALFPALSGAQGGFASLARGALRGFEGRAAQHLVAA